MRDMQGRMARVEAKRETIERLEKIFRETSIHPDQLNGYLERIGSAPLRQGMKLHSVLMRPKVSIEGLREVLPELAQELAGYEPDFIRSAEIEMKYAGYITREQEQVDRMNRLESVHLHEDFEYHALKGLSNEAREKLTQLKPVTIGQASRISGVSPADVSVLLVHLGR